MVNYSGTYATPRPDLGAAYQEYMEAPGLFIALQVAPSFDSPVQKANYSSITRESMLKTVDAKRSAEGSYNRITMGAEDKSFACEEFGVEAKVDDKQRRFFANDFDHSMASMDQAMLRLKIAQEKRVNTLIFNTTTWSGAALFTDNSGSPWSTAGSGVIAQVEAAKEKVRKATGMPANALIIGAESLSNLLANTGIIGRFPGAVLVTEAMIRANVAAIFGLQNLIVGTAVENTADEGQTATVADIWAKTYAMVARVCPQGAPISVPCVARSPRWVLESPLDMMVEQYREEQVRADILRVRHDFDEVVQDSSMGHLMKVEA